MSNSFERGFTTLAAIGVVLAIAVFVAAPSTEPNMGGFTFTPDVPEEYTFSEPTKDGTVRIENTQFETLRAALAAATPGDTLRLRGRFEGPVTIDTSGLTLVGTSDSLALLEGRGKGDVLTINGRDVTLRRIWVRNSGRDAANNDSGIWINGANAKIVDSRVTAITFGIWINGVDSVRVANTTIVGRESVRPLSYRGNGIQIWKTEHSRLVNNRITDVRDGLYYSWASEVLARGNTMWDLRYGVHYMYS
ncbi:MAG: nitrous oxide reductase family maturation protein NosD, partial [Salinibacter sp.]